MPAEQGYRQQVGVASPVALPSASPAAFGAGVGQAVSQLGDTIHNSNVRAYQVERKLKADQEWADAVAQFADRRSELDRADTDARANPQAGGAGHVERLTQTADQMLEGLADNLPEDSARQRMRQMVAEYRGNYLDRAYTWQVGQATKKSITDLGTLADKASARVFTSGDPGTAAANYAIETAMFSASVYGATGLGEDVREALVRDGSTKLAKAYLGQLTDSNPAAAQAMIDAGTFNDVFDADELRAQRNTAEAALNAAAARARAAAASAIADRREALATAKARLENGEGTPADFEQVAAGYDAIGDTSAAVEIRAKGKGRIVADGSNDRTLGELDAEITRLTGKRRGGGLTGDEAALLTGLQDKRTQQAARLDRDGGALVQEQFATGVPMRPLNPADPQSMAERGGAAVRAARRWGGAVEPITDADLRSFRATYGNGPGGQMAALAAIRQFREPAAVLGAARQLTGSDTSDAARAFRIAAGLPDDGARSVLNGNRLLAGGTVGKLWNEREARAVWNSYRSVMAPLGVELTSDLYAAAKAYFVDRLTAGGEAEWNRQSSGGHFANSIEAMLGRARGRDGTTRGGLYRGNPRGFVIAPPDMTGEQMQRRFSRASAADYQRASGGRRAVWSDGTPIGEQDLRTRLLPTLLSDGRYGFRGSDNHWIKDTAGKDYIIDIRQLPGR